MDISRVSTAEKIAGVAGVVLLLVMFIFDWYSASGFGINAWDAFGVIDLILFVTAAAAIALAVLSANSQSPNLMVAPSAIVAGLGILATVLVLYRVLDVPGPGGLGVDRGIGLFIGLIASAGIAYGGWTAMKEEGTSFSEQADRVQNRSGSGGGTGTGTGSSGGTRTSGGGGGTPAA